MRKQLIQNLKFDANGYVQLLVDLKPTNTFKPVVGVFVNQENKNQIVQVKSTADDKGVVTFQTSEIITQGS